MKRWILAIVLLLSYYSPSFSQEYFFSIPSVQLDVEVQTNGGALLHYTIDFQNSAKGHVIDIVDVGLPNEKYNTRNIKAWVNGQEVPGSIQSSQYVKPGVEVPLGNLSIPPGGSGTFQFETVIPDLVYQDTTRKDYASMQISPTWFGSQYVEGTTGLTIRILLPSGLKVEEVLHQDVVFTDKTVDPDGNIVVSWKVNRPFTSEYRVGVSFPKRGMQNIVTMTTSQLLMRWWRGIFPTHARGWLLAAAAVLLFIIYMRFTGGTGCIFFAPVVIAAAFFFVAFDAAEILIWPVLIVLAIVVETARKRRKSRYLPAIASVEGGGLKRGLTAPEAAVLLELPVNKLITLVLFGMLKKGVIRQTKKEPITVEIVEPPPIEAVLHDYEKEFLKTLMEPKSATSVNEIDFSKALQRLVDSVAKRMVGYDVDETREYYKHIISRAWKEAQEIGEVDAWQKKMDEKIDWMMIDPDFAGRFRPYQDRYIPRPYRPTSTAPIGGSGSSSKTSSEGTTRFSDVAASVSGWFQSTAESAVGSVEGQKGGILNLGSIDKAIGKAMASSGGGGRSGGGGGCACACAGCACACACAGGGR